MRPAAVPPPVHLPPGWLEGTVIEASAPYEEPPDARPGRAVLLALFNVPLLAAAAMLGMALLLIALPLRLIGFGGPSLLTILALMNLSRPGNRPTTVPVRNWRIAGDDGREFQARLKGRLAGGVLERGDRARLRGRWRDGVLHVIEGTNLRTTSRLRAAPDLSLRWVLPASLFWLLILSAWLQAPR